MDGEVTEIIVQKRWLIDDNENTRAIDVVMSATTI